MDKYIAQIKTAKSKQEIMDINYEAFKDMSITMKQHDLLTSLGVWKETELNGGDTQECARVLKIPKIYINKIKN